MAAAGDIIISVKPEHAHNIIMGRKTVELRRRFADTSAIGRWMLILSFPKITSGLDSHRKAESSHH
jgi:hypothetical protein